MPKTNIRVKLVGRDGNAWVIIGKVQGALMRADHKKLAKEFQKEAMSGDYDHLLRTCMKYVEVH